MDPTQQQSQGNSSPSGYRQQQQQPYPPQGYVGNAAQQQQYPTQQQQQGAWETYAQAQQRQLEQQQQQLPNQQHLLPPPPPPPLTSQHQPQPSTTTSKRTTRARTNTKQQGYQNIVPAIVKRETNPANQANMSSTTSRGDSKEGIAAAASGSAHHDDPMPSTSDFVKKLYKMLEDPNFQSVVSWGPQGDCFVVKDMNEFTKSILPRMFKHSNFASFVRQLNKYDFHKVKNTDDCQFGEHSWTFRHPDFHADRRDALENIKRKVPAQRKNTASTSLSSLPYPPPSSLASSSVASPLSSQATLELQQTASNLQHEVRRLRDDNEDLKGRLRQLERQYENVLVEMVGFQRGMTQQDGVMQSLIAYFMSGQGSSQEGSGEGAGAGGRGKSSPRSSNPSSFGVPPVSSLPTPAFSAVFPPTAQSATSTNASATFPDCSYPQISSAKVDSFTMDVDSRSRYGSVSGSGSFVSY